MKSIAGNSGSPLCGKINPITLTASKIDSNDVPAFILYNHQYLHLWKVVVQQRPSPADIGF